MSGKSSAAVNVKARARLFEQAPQQQQPSKPAERRGSTSAAAEGRKRHAEAALKAGTVRQVLKQVEEQRLDVPPSTSRRSSVVPDNEDASKVEKRAVSPEPQKSFSAAESAVEKIDKSGVKTATVEDAPKKIADCEVDTAGLRKKDVDEESSKKKLGNESVKNAKESNIVAAAAVVATGEDEKKSKAKAKRKGDGSEAVRVKRIGNKTKAETVPDERAEERTKVVVEPDKTLDKAEKSLSVEIILKQEEVSKTAQAVHEGKASDSLPVERNDLNVEDKISQSESPSVEEVGEEKQQTSAESESKNTCLLSELKQPQSDLKITQLLLEECTGERTTESSNPAAATDANLLTSVADLKFTPDSGDDSQPKVSQADGTGQVDVVLERKVRSTFWQLLSDSGSASSTSDGEAPVCGKSSVPHGSEWHVQDTRQPSTLLDKLGLVQSRSSTASPEFYGNENESTDHQFLKLDVDGEAKSFYKHDADKQAVSKPKNNSQLIKANYDKLLTSRLEHVSKLVQSSPNSSWLPAGYDQPIFSNTSSTDRERFKPESTNYNQDLGLKYDSQVNPTLQELLTSVQRIQEEFGKTNIDTSDVDDQSLEQTLAETDSKVSTCRASELHERRPLISRAFYDSYASSNNLAKNGASRLLDCHLSQPKPLNNESTYQHHVPYEADTTVPTNINKHVGKTVQFEPVVKYTFAKDDEENGVFLPHCDEPANDGTISRPEKILTADELIMERKVNPLTHGNIVTSHDKLKRPINITPISVRKFDSTAPPGSGTPLINPLSPTARTQVRHKPELPASFTLTRKTYKTDLNTSKLDPNTFSDSEKCEYDKIESILSELDFSKYRRGRPTHLSVQQHTLPRSLSESPRPGTRVPLPRSKQPQRVHSQEQPTTSDNKQVPPKLQHQHSLPVENKSNCEKLKELTKRLKPNAFGKSSTETGASDLTTVSPPPVAVLPEHHHHQQLLLQQQLQNHQLQQQLLQQQQQLQQLQQQHLQQLQELAQQSQQATSASYPPRPVSRSASFSHVDFSDEGNFAWQSSLPRNLKSPPQTKLPDQQRIVSPSGASTIQLQKMDSDTCVSVADEGLVADDDATSNYMQAYCNVTTLPGAAGPTVRQQFSENVRIEPLTETASKLGDLNHGGGSDKRKRRKNINPNAIGFHAGSYDVPPKTGNGRSLTYPPQRKGSISEGMEYTSMDSNGLKSYATNLMGDTSHLADESAQHLSNLSLADSHFCSTEVSVGETYQDVVESVVHEPSDINRLDDRSGKTFKKKHYSDPSGDKNDGLLDLPELIATCKSEPQLGDKTKDNGLRLQIIETSTEPISHGSSSVGLYSHQQSPRVGLKLTHSVSSGSDGYSSDKDRYMQKSPQQQRRYSKKRLRGPYGEMLEEEMRKSGEKQLQKQSIAEELSFLQELSEPKPSSLLCSSESADATTLASLYSSPNIGNLAGDVWSGLLSQEGQDNSSDNDHEVAVSTKQPQDTRTHVVGELYDIERSYVDSLQILVNKYYKPLKSPENTGLVDASLVDTMFFQVPEILSHHETFLDLLRCRLENWDGKQKVGDVFVEAFTKQQVINTYTAFINNWKSAKEAIKIAVQAKPAFAKFLGHMSREHKGKLTLDALLIMPVQRIPRYELLIKELLKHTQVDHPDHRLLVLAQQQVHDLAMKINHMEREDYETEQMQQKLKEIENLIDGLIDLVHIHRSFIRYDLVTMSGGLGTKKERCLFLFSDLLIITSIKRKSGTIRKASAASNSPGSLQNTLEMNKYKLLMKLSLDDLDIIKTNGSNVKKALKEMEQLELDNNLIGQINDLAYNLNCNHQSLDELLKEMQIAIARQLQEKHNNEAQLLYLEMTVTTQEGVENLSMVFNTAEKRAHWEAAFVDAKQKLAVTADYRLPPEFLTPLPIRKTRAGLQFTCASATLGLNSHNLRDVWVCNSDGYVGQVCILSLQPEATVTSCNGVCNARILCIASVPAAAPPPETFKQRRRAYTAESKTPISISVEDVDTKNEKNTGNNIQLDSESSDDDDEGIESQDEEGRKRRGDSLPPGDCLEVDDQQPTMWLGTEDGCIHIYNCNDNIRMKKNKVKLQHAAAVHCILYMDNTVFISLANGDLTAYKHDCVGGWNTIEPQTVAVGSAACPVTKMISVMGKLWCGCHNYIKVVNTTTLEIEKSFVAISDSARSVLCMAASGFGVWVSAQNSATIRLFHAATYDCLYDISVTPSVTKMLAGCDDIIRQHKAACLRVTALLACKDLLWVGTSAGVILNVTIPHLTSTSSKLISPPTITGIPHGHTGHVRFLSCVEMQPAVEGINRSKYSNRSIKLKDSHSLFRRSSISATITSKILVLSGGDGYEDFRNTNISEAAGRDDSTNHLLLWQV